MHLLINGHVSLRKPDVTGCFGENVENEEKPIVKSPISVCRKRLSISNPFVKKQS